MKISKPVMTPQSKQKKPKKIARPTPSLKKLLFVADQPKYKLKVVQTPRNSQQPRKHDLKTTHSAVSLATKNKPKAHSLNDKTYLTAIKQS
jgi:hypothetical protein